MFDFVNKYFWAIAAGVTLVNFRRRTASPSSQPYGSSSSDDDVLYRRARVAMVAPWVVMGIGIIFGGVPGVQNYFRPQDLNPYVWAWYCCVFILSCVFAYWVILRDGARRAIELQLIRNRSGRPVQMSERQLKVYAASGPFLVVLWICFAWYLNVPTHSH
jgi:hypothetical protein